MEVATPVLLEVATPVVVSELLLVSSKGDCTLPALLGGGDITTSVLLLVECGEVTTPVL